jgi:signal peptidase complex subunit 3
LVTPPEINQVRIIAVVAAAATLVVAVAAGVDDASDDVHYCTHSSVTLVIYVSLSHTHTHVRCCRCSNFTYKNVLSVVETLQLNKLRSLKSHGGVDRALLSFDLKVDLTPAFHWNIKQLFVYVVASYNTTEDDDDEETNASRKNSKSKSNKKGKRGNRTNQVVLWDKIVEATDPKMMDEENIFVKYALVDQGAALRNKEVTLQLQWDHMPITGLLYRNEQAIDSASTFQLPAEYQ